MLKFMNFSDGVVIGLSAYVVIFGINYFLRQAGMKDYQA